MSKLVSVGSSPFETARWIYWTIATAQALEPGITVDWLRTTL